MTLWVFSSLWMNDTAGMKSSRCLSCQRDQDRKSQKQGNKDAIVRLIVRLVSGAGHAQLRVYSGSGWTYKSKLCTLMSASSFLVHIRLESKDYTHRGCNEGSRSRSAGKRWPSRKSLQFLGHGCFSLNLCIHHLTSVTHLLFFNLHLQLIVTSEIIHFKYTDLERKGEDPWPFLSHKRRRSRFSY